MKALFYMPTMMVDFIRAIFFPRWLFLATYKMQSEQLREAENQVRNATRLVDYHLKRTMIVDDE